ncbi:hypothetical protein [Actinoplanes utahensis]|uniref:Dihydrofolate reductase n=1 Tax=Actinoplanes utahensis TaxID=1869 RepID=A0A0A6XD18_ACTUT|nr:hypothetical protein [Actinoplanes utahensis]KHD77987.1 hypothetical protein MB27_07685 [Actinoplanes utahensis]GIF29973.1 hypothetical protein Aut01nite_29590 [Actinoplanes utahensis]
MTVSVRYMSMSVDGYISAPDGGLGGLHDWFVTPDGRFERPSGATVREIVRVVDTPEATHPRHRVR